MDEVKMILSEKQVLQNIQNGCSINSQAKECKVSWDAIKRICDEQGVDSKHTCVKATEKDILQMLEEYKVATSKEIAAYFGFNTENYQSLRYRLQSMVRRNKIKRTKFTTLKTPKKNRYTFFDGYMETYLFYKKDSDFRQWAVDRIPVGLPKSIRKTLTQYLNNQGIHIDLSKIIPMKSVSFTMEEYKKLKQKAKKKQKGIKELILDAI